MNCLPAAPNAPGKNVRALFQPGAPALLHRVNELGVDIVKNLLKYLLFFRVRRRERVKHSFSVAGCDQAPLDPKLLERLNEPEAARYNANRPDNACRVDINFIRCRSNIVSTRCADIGDDGSPRRLSKAKR